jgi:hypothetical protein
MNFYQKKLEEKKNNPKIPKDKTLDLKKTKIDGMRRPAKNAKLGMF